MTIHIRSSIESDATFLTHCFADTEILRWFPIKSTREVEDCVRIWMGYLRYPSSFTAEYEGELAGMAVLYLQPYQKFAHHALFAIIVDGKYRSKGIGKKLLEHLQTVARNDYQVKILHLEVYEGNPAIRLYERMGFQEYGRHPRFIKEAPGEYIGKILMQKEL